MARMETELQLLPSHHTDNGCSMQRVIIVKNKECFKLHFYLFCSGGKEKLQDEYCPRLLDGFYRATIEGLTPPDPYVVKIRGTKLEYYLGTQIESKSKIEYGQVL